MTVGFCFSLPPQELSAIGPDGRCPRLRALGWLAAQLHEQLVSDRLRRVLARTVPTTLTPLSGGQEILGGEWWPGPPDLSSCLGFK